MSIEMEAFFMLGIFAGFMAILIGIFAGFMAILIYTLGDGLEDKE